MVQHRFSGHTVTGKICGLKLVDIVNFHMILLLKKQCLQIRMTLVLYAQPTWHFDGWRRPTQCQWDSWNSRCTRSTWIWLPVNKAYGNKSNYDTFPSISFTVTKSDFSMKCCLTSDWSAGKPHPTNTKLSTRWNQALKKTEDLSTRLSSFVTQILSLKCKNRQPLTMIHF